MNPDRTHLDAPSRHDASVAIDSLPLPSLEIDAQGIVTRANQAALALHPPEQGRLIGQSAFAFLVGGERELSRQSFAALLASPHSAPSAVIRYIYDRGGQYSAYQLHRSVIRNSAGNPTGMCILGVNVAAATEALQEIHRRNGVATLSCGLRAVA